MSHVINPVAYAARLAVGEIAHADQLFQHLTDGQITFHTLKAAGAKNATRAAANLRADTSGATIVFLNKDAFDQLLVV